MPNSHTDSDAAVNPFIQLRRMLGPLFCALTGYTEKAVRRKIEEGIWLQGGTSGRRPTATLRWTSKPITPGLKGKTETTETISRALRVRASVEI